MFVQADDAAHYSAVVLKMGMPIAVREHDIWRAIGTMLIGAMEDTAQTRWNAQCIKVVPGYFVDPCAGWIVARIQSDLSERKACQTIEAAVAVAQVEIVG